MSRVSQYGLQIKRETVPLIRFLFAYAGLEVIADKAYEDVRLATWEAIEATHAEGQQAIREMFYPMPSPKSPDPLRSILARFSTVAFAFSPRTADEDVATFKRINNYRNTIHGRIELPARPPADDAVDLFSRYRKLALTHFKSRPRGSK